MSNFVNVQWRAALRKANLDGAKLFSDLSYFSHDRNRIYRGGSDLREAMHTAVDRFIADRGSTTENLLREGYLKETVDEIARRVRLA